MAFCCEHVHAVNRHSPREIIEKRNLQADWRTVDRFVERRVPSYARIFRRWVDGTSAQITDEAIRIAIDTADAAPITGLFVGLPTPEPEYEGFDRVTPVVKTYEEMVSLEASIAEAMLAEDVGIAMAIGASAWDALPFKVTGSFNIKNPYVVPACQERVGWLITEVRNGTQRGLRQAIADITSLAYETPLTPAQAARRIRGVIGLRHDQINALTKIERDLMGAGVRGEALSKRMARESLKRLRYRANMIGRTELHRSASVGRHAAWQEARDRGLMAGRTAYVEWVAGLTERTCPICANLNGEREELGGIFRTTEDIPDSQSVAGEYPPIHPLCRCTTVLVLESK